MLLTSPSLATNHLHRASHAVGMKWHLSDHVPVLFTFNTRTWSSREHRTPWRCPLLLLRCADIQKHHQKTLSTLMTCLATAHTHPNSNPGCLLDEHKRSDAIYLRTKFATRRNATSRKLADLPSATSRPAHSHPTATNLTAAQAAETEYDSYYDHLRAQAKAARFDDALTHDERCSREFFHPPSTSAYPTTIPVHSAGEHAVVSQGFRSYWANIFRSPSRDIQPYIPTDDTLLTRLLQSTSFSLTPSSRQALDAPFTAWDFYDAITHTAKARAQALMAFPLITSTSLRLPGLKSFASATTPNSPKAA
ncbi:hypothetical protein DYB32_009231 [Aphanomyces invadans]|nr:hypothetical protein DYB32_009231 [Aphanomyces invadans]